MRYRPVEGGRDQTDAIGDAVEELLREPPGDVLVFLSGEREIRDTAEALQGRLRPDVEILPLYAQAVDARAAPRVPAAAARGAIVLATNVAETSLTVPGIRYVVDPGIARISRYSARLKVQRLPIEPVSQASADQRKGRCGRVADGHLHPALRRAGLRAAAALHRPGDPPHEPRQRASSRWRRRSSATSPTSRSSTRPTARQVRDGIRLLQELAALDEREELTPLGRRLAQLPVDPRLGRMILEADRHGCAEEVIVITAALSIQDPRERPAEKREQADQLHARFADEHSDFIAFLNLWRYLREQQRALSGNQFRRRCHAEFLHHLRVREWQDLVAQLRQAAKQVDVTLNRAEAEPDTVHAALLSGLLSQLGLKDPARREFQGARGARFALWPGSALAKRPPTWVMVAELVETSRLWGRVAARIDPRAVEPLAQHLVSRTYDEPRWNRKRASVVATERVTLYGLPIVAGRTVAYGGIDPELSRSLFIRSALVEGDWEARHRFLAANRELLERVDELEARARRRDIRVTDQGLYDFYDARIPADVVSGAHFDRWWRDARRADPDLLTFREADVAGEAAAALDRRAVPEAWRQGDLTLPLSYVFDPGAARDGVTVHVPLTVLPQLKPLGFDWLVPALREELVTVLIRSLPKEYRRSLVPVPEVVAAVLARVTPRSEPLLDALERELEALRGVRIPRSAWDLGRLPPHLRMTFRVEDDRGALVAEGDDLDALREQVRPRLRERLSAAASPLERHGMTRWEAGDLPKAVALPGTGGSVRGYPALVDEGATVGVRVLETSAAQRAAMHAGTRKLLALDMPSPIRHLQGRLSAEDALALARAPGGNPRAVLEDATVAALESLMAEAGGPAWDAAGFARLRAHVAGRAGGADGGDRAAGGADPRRGARRRAPARAARPRPRVRRGARRRRPAARAARPSRLRRRDRRRTARRRRALPARGRAAARAAAGRARPGPRQAARRPGARAGVRGARGLVAGRPAAPARAARHPVAARGAARGALRPGPRRARAGVGEADPARDPRGRPGLTTAGSARRRAARPCPGPCRPSAWRAAGAAGPSTGRARPGSRPAGPCPRRGRRRPARRPPRASAACAPPPRATRSVASPIRQPCLDGTSRPPPPRWDRNPAR